MDSSVSMISIAFEAISAVAVTLTLVAIGVVLTKTPKAMKRYKIYLLFYAVHLLLLELATGVYCPAALHPYVFFYPLGIAKHLPPKVSMTIFGISFYHAMSLYDCTIAMILERYYAMKNLTKMPSKVPLYSFIFLSGFSCCYLIFMLAVVFYPPLHDLLFVPVEENLHIIETLFGSQSKEMLTDSILIFQNYRPNTIPLFAAILLVLEGVQLPIILGLLTISGRASKTLNSQISPNLQKYNAMFFRMITLQFFGIVVFVGIPYLIIFSVTLFVETPNQMISWSFVIIDCFGVYDVLVMVICIKPYRDVCASWLSFGCGRGNKVTVAALISSSTPSVKIGD